MKTSIISALAAVSGAAVGGLTNAIANWMSNKSQIRAQSFQREMNRRQVLYRDFIEEAAKCYIVALQRSEADISDLVGLYAKVSRMKVQSSAPVVASAESIARTILDTYLEPAKTFVELRDMANNGTFDLLRDFSAACRQEFEELNWRF
jgi:hypothetical protein